MESLPMLSARNVFKAQITEIHPMETRVLVYLDAGARFVAEITHGALKELAFRPGQDVFAVVNSNSILSMDSPKA